MSESNWNLEENYDEGMLEELRRVKMSKMGTLEKYFMKRDELEEDMSHVLFDGQMNDYASSQRFYESEIQRIFRGDQTMPLDDWMNEENSNEETRYEELRQQKAQQLKEDLVEEKWREYNYAHEHAFSADLIKARRER